MAVKSENGGICFGVEVCGICEMVAVLKPALILLPTNSSSRALKMAESNRLLICSSVHGDGIKGAGGNKIAAAGTTGAYGGGGAAGGGAAIVGISAAGISGGTKAVGVCVKAAGGSESMCGGSDAGGKSCGGLIKGAAGNAGGALVK